MELILPPLQDAPIAPSFSVLLLICLRHAPKSTHKGINIFLSLFIVEGGDPAAGATTPSEMPQAEIQVEPPRTYFI